MPDTFPVQNDTIAAVATPPGAGGIAVVRVSGPDALAVLNRLFKTNSRIEHARMCYGRVTDADGQTLDTGYGVYFSAPKSFTGEDVAELHVHGGFVGVARVLARAVECGARAARPGEFSRRAFVNGKLDLTMAEAICDYIAAEGEACAREAARQMDGSLGARINPIAESLVDLIADAEAAVEYPEEDLEDALITRSQSQITGAARKLKALRDTYRQGRFLRDGVSVVIAGKPNAGKSSVLNALLGERRAIVSDTPGTTRDIVGARVSIDGFVFALSDTAGMRQSEDDIERQGVELAKSAVSNADIVLLTLDASRPLDEGDAAARDAALASGAEVITLLNKIDISPAQLSIKDAEDFAQTPVLRVSALDNRCGDIVGRALIGAVRENSSIGQGVAIINARHAELLDAAQLSLQDALTALTEGLGAECALTDLTDALSNLYEITGKSVDKEVIDRIFARFCLGK